MEIKVLLTEAFHQSLAFTSSRTFPLLWLCGVANHGHFISVTGCSEVRAPAGVQCRARRSSGLLGCLGCLVHLFPDLWKRGKRAKQALPACLHSIPIPLQKSWCLSPAGRPCRFSPAANLSFAQRCRQVLQQQQPRRVEGGEADPPWWTQVLHHMAQGSKVIKSIYQGYFFILGGATKP